MKQPTILVVDNNTNVRETMRSVLSVLGIESVGCQDGHEALEMIRSSSYDGVISDVVMPEMSGLDLVSKLKMQAPALPIIMMSSYASEALEKEAMSKGAVGLMPKPFKVNMVASLLSSANIKYTDLA